MLDAKAKKAAIEIAKKLASQIDSEDIKNPKAFKDAATNPEKAKEELKQNLIQSSRTISEEEETSEKKEKTIKSAIRKAFIHMEEIAGLNMFSMSIPFSALSIAAANLLPGGITTEQGIVLWAGTWAASIALHMVSLAGNMIMGVTDAERDPIQKSLMSIKEIKELIKEHFPNYQIMELYTYEHTGMCIEKFKRCEWDSSLDGMSVFKKETDLDEKLEIINKNLI